MFSLHWGSPGFALALLGLELSSAAQTAHGGVGLVVGL